MSLFARSRRADVATPGPGSAEDRGPSWRPGAAEDLPVALRDPDPAQLMWMEELREFLRAPRAPLDLDRVDQLFRTYCISWHAQAPEQRWNPNTVINALGVVLGDQVRLVRPDLRWQVLATSGPTTLVLATDVAVAYPLTSVAEHWMAGHIDWMRHYPCQIGAAVARPTTRFWAPGGALR